MVINRLLNQDDASLTIAIYRILFGLLMCISLLRFMYEGWIEACYLSTDFHFTYQYFSWVKPSIHLNTMYCLVACGCILAIMIAIGFLYRFAIISFFFLFTYLELIEKSWYLNHYYFVSIIAFLLCFIPADNALALNRKGRKALASTYANVLRLQIAIVYFYAGLAKLRSDWLLEAQPLKTWLKTKTDIPFIGQWFAYEETAYLFSYGGAIYDLSIPFLLYYSKTRPLALIAVIGFHVMTAILFPIGMFPWIMIAGSLIFITDAEWKKHLKITGLATSLVKAPKAPNWILFVLGIHFIIQLFLPARRFFYPENQLWTERNYRFGWNVMLAEKTGRTKFKITDLSNGKTWVEYPKDELTIIQNKQMSYQPDMIWQYANHLAKQYADKGVDSVSVFVDCFVSFNGRPATRYLPSTLDLNKITIDEVYDHVLPAPE